VGVLSAPCAPTKRRPFAPLHRCGLAHLTSVAPIGSAFDYYKPAAGHPRVADLFADLSEGASSGLRSADLSARASSLGARLISAPSRIPSNGALACGDKSRLLADAYAPAGGVINNAGQVQLYALCNDFDPEFFADRFGTDLTMTRSSSRSDYSISLVGGLVSRMRITSGVVLPSDTPIHLICGSKDVIHSWAIPGLSVKVDCIPGYNCHRRLLIR
jgi:hypothetical protein